MPFLTNEIDQLARRLYDGGLNHGSEDFSHWALRQLTDLLGIAGIQWTKEDSRMQPTDQIQVGMAASGQLQSEDCLKVAVPGVSGNDWHRFEFRSGNGAFSEPDELEIKRLAAFMVHADWVHRQIVQTRMSGALRKVDGQAILDQQGQIISADTAFKNLMSAEAPQWDQHSLPQPIDWTAASGRSGQALGNLRLFAARVGQHIQLRLCRSQTHEALSAREIEVARLIARGRTFKEAARELDLAPSTVSTHLYSVYNKLEIKGRAELIDWLSAQRDWI